MHDLGLPPTILRPMAFMELMTDKKFLPRSVDLASHARADGASPQSCMALHSDLGAIAARVFANPDKFIGQDLRLASDRQSIDECRSIYRAGMGKNPPRFPLPTWLFGRFGFVGKDLSTMWRWLRTATIDEDIETARSIHPEALSVEKWLSKQKK